MTPRATRDDRPGGDRPPASPATAVAVERSLLEGDPVEVAPDLLGKILQVGSCRGRIVEVEAYRGATDDASHAYRGRTPRNATMFGPAGHLYVYFTYGMHHCANVVCRPEGEPGAVLLRALAPIEGLGEMTERRSVVRSPRHVGWPGDSPPALRSEDLCSGPAKLCEALGIDRAWDGRDLLAENAGVALLDDGTAAPRRAVGTRIGLSPACASRTLHWRWWVPGDPNVSRPRG
jgi:DNA-3-methyladenine glycosylase